MKLAFSLCDWQASAPGLAGLADWQQWATKSPAIDETLPLAKAQHLPMMTARRLSSGSRAAVECGLALIKRQPVDAVVFTSRHGELERNLRILTSLAKEEGLSPTDFAMSVHNAAVGSLTIAAALPLVSTSLAAGADSFQQGLLEVATLHSAGYQQVLLVDLTAQSRHFISTICPKEHCTVLMRWHCCCAREQTAAARPFRQKTKPQTFCHKACSFYMPGYDENGHLW